MRRSAVPVRIRNGAMGRQATVRTLIPIFVARGPGSGAREATDHLLNPIMSESSSPVEAVVVVFAFTWAINALTLASVIPVKGDG